MISKSVGRRQLLAGVAIAVCAGVPAQWSADPNVNTPVCIDAASQLLPQVASDGAGGSLIVWQDFRPGASADIYAQRLDADGVALWAANGVAVTTAAQSQVAPHIVADGAGGCIIAWADTRSSGLGDIYAQRLNASGAPQWAADGVPVCTAADQQITVQIASDGGGGAIVVWNDLRGGDINAYDIYAQRLNASGAPQWTIDGSIVGSGVFQNDRRALLSDGAGGLFVAWSGRTGGVVDVFAQRLNAAGARQWAVAGAPVCTATGDQLILSPGSICADTAGGAIVVWDDARGGSDRDVYAQRLDSAGVPQWTLDGTPVTTAAGDQFIPTLIADGSGGAITMFQSGALGSHDIMAQRLNASGAPQWGSSGVTACAASGDQFVRSLVSDGAGGAILGWQDGRSAGSSGFDVYAQRLDGGGAAQWQADGEPVCTAAGEQYVPLTSPITADGAGGAILAWEDGRTGSDIFAGRIRADGTLATTTAASSWSAYR